MSNPTTSPLLAQYRAVRDTLPKGTILLYKLGDFYEVFDEEARTVASILNLTYTKRGDALMAGIPYHCLDKWTGVLIGRGHQVALCEEFNVKQSAKTVAESVRFVTITE